MYHQTVKVFGDEARYRHGRFFDIVQVGTGGTGGYLVQRLSKMLYSFMKADFNFSFRYCLVDGDSVESKNLLRQPFIDEDIGLPKAQVLAERYSNVYDIPILRNGSYLESLDSISACFPFYKSNYSWVRILVGCVDNHATRRLLHKYFKESDSVLIYLDSGVDSVLAEGTEEEIADSGWSGHVVCGYKKREKEILPSVADVFPDILEDTSKLPTESCGDVVVYQPQRMQANEMAALVLASYFNNLFASNEIVSSMTNFNAKTMLCRPTYIQEEETKVGSA